MDPSGYVAIPPDHVGMWEEYRYRLISQNRAYIPTTFMDLMESCTPWVRY